MNSVRFGVATGLAALISLAVGTVRGAMIVAEAQLDGLSEASPNASPGTGFARVTYDPAAQTLRVEVTFSGLMASATAAHIHAATAAPNTGTAGVATPVPTFPGFPAATAGAYDQTFDLTSPASWNPAYVTANGGTPAGAEAAFAAALGTERTYLNIHTSLFPAGEIRGFLRPVPDSSIPLWLMGSSLAVLAGSSRRLRVASNR